MTSQILEWLHRARRIVGNPGRVCEIGACNINGTPRSHFQEGAREYIGVDVRPGPGVDIISSAHHLPFCNGFDTIICCEMLEHDDNPLATIQEMRRLLLPGGHLLVTSPANGFHVHRYPRDYWRLMPDVYDDIIFKDMKVLDKHVTADPCTCYLGLRERT